MEEISELSSKDISNSIETKSKQIFENEPNNNDKENKILDSTISKDAESVTNSDIKSTNSEPDWEQYSKFITYTADGIATYSDPKTNLKYIFSESLQKWEQIGEETKIGNPYENEHYRWCFETNKWIPKVKHHEPNVEYSIEEGLHTYKDEDGTTFFFDQTKKAWFPKIDDDFMAIYQLNYGFDKDGNQTRKVVDDDGFKIPISIREDIAGKGHKKNTSEESRNIETVNIKKRKIAEPPKWFDITPNQNTKVYVSNLPLDITEQEFVDLMSKCGLIMKDPKSQKFKVKLYTDSNGMLKGDGLCDYIKVESVSLSLNILDGYDFRGNKINVESAKFEMRGEYNPALKPKKKKKDKEKLAKLKEKLLDWRPDKMRGERSKHERVVIIKNLFDSKTFDENVELILEYQNDLREECSKCGIVRKVTIYDRHTDGIASISMSCPEEADLVVQMMNRRFYGKRRLIAEIWDGKSKYKVEESTKEEQKRLNNWDTYLENVCETNDKKEKNTPNNENEALSKVKLLTQ